MKNINIFCFLSPLFGQNANYRTVGAKCFRTTKNKTLYAEKLKQKQIAKQNQFGGDNLKNKASQKLVINVGKTKQRKSEEMKEHMDVIKTYKWEKKNSV